MSKKTRKKQRKRNPVRLESRREKCPDCGELLSKISKTEYCKVCGLKRMKGQYISRIIKKNDLPRVAV